MDEKGTSGFIILVYAIGLITAVLLLLLSNKLFTPLLIEVNSGKSIINLFFNKDDHLNFTLNLIVPLLLQIVGIIILVIIFWCLVKSIFLCEDTSSIKIIMGILSLLLIAMLIKAMIVVWPIIQITFLSIICFVFMIVVLGSLINSTSSSQ
ncbi:hypothetical protein MHI04_18030 [Lysinibacillus sp. FSL K6-1151]|uniref:hypothetical protein n=1 Tax=Lysinibacillus sp. FSL K6-1151 TaxID=2921465 RepID=UPI00315A2172